MLEKSTQKTKSLRDLIYFPTAFNLVALILVGTLYGGSPEHSVEPDVLNTVLYLGVFATEWSLFYVIVRRLGTDGLRKLITPKRKLRWLPSILAFASLNVLFTSYMVLALAYGRIPPWGNLNPFQVVFYVVLSPLTAGIVEELIWRGYFIEKLLTMGKTEWKAVIFSSVSFAFIHGFIIFDKLVVTFIFGIIAGAYYVRERNLPVLMATHLVVDIIAFGLLVFNMV